MKNLVKKFIKLLYVVIVPILGIVSSALYFNEYGSGYMPVTIIIVSMSIFCILNAVFFTVFMDKVILLPKIDARFESIIGLGVAWQKTSLMIVLPFTTIEVKWKK